MTEQKEKKYTGYGYHGGGRKATGIKRISICISGQPEQIEELKQQAAAKNMTVSAYIFQLANINKNERQNGELTDKVKELEAQIEKMKYLLNEIYSEYGFSELVKIRNNLPIEIQEVIKEIKENE